MRTSNIEQEAVPYFQPIISLQTQRIMGYESLGRRVVAGGVESLGPFFQDAGIRDRVHLRVDRILREQAIRKVQGLEAEQSMFLNLKPSWIYKHYKKYGSLKTLELIDLYGIDPKQVVIEITEEEFSGGLPELTRIVQLYREKGCTIAVDDIGSGFSNFDRIALIRPQILKVDLNILKKSEVHTGYKAILRSFSILASQIGASLLVEGVETRRDLHTALQVGARYVQGYFFARAEPDFLDADVYASMLNEELASFSGEAFGKFQQLIALEDQFDELMLRDTDDLFRPEQANRLVAGLGEVVYSNCIKMYICKEDGIQVSANYVREVGGEWRSDSRYLGSNWVWRPHFIPNIMTMNKRGKGILSSAYTDLDNACLIQTYSFPLGNGYYMFLDLAV